MTTWLDLLTRVAADLHAAGLPIARFALFEPTLHPTVLGRAFFWSPSAPPRIETMNALSGTLDEASSVVLGPTFRGSPIFRIFLDKFEIRRDLTSEGEPGEHPVFRELREQGMIGYFALPILFRGGGVDALSICTQRPSGFTEEEIANVRYIARPLARLLETVALQHTAEGLLATYLGHRAGTRVLAGRVHRGDLDLLRAVVWFSDLRGFTAASASRPPRAVIEMVNDLFECQVPAIGRHGGEVLKFIGDGLLAIFPCSENAAETAAVCADALQAADEAFAALAAKNGDQPEPLRMGLALHLGEVAYGNVGGASRLDFTAIGPAVNLAARLESLTTKVERRVLVSSDFARHAGRPVTSAGTFPLKGIPTPHEVFFPAGHDDPC